MTFLIISSIIIILASALSGRAVGAEWGVARWQEKLIIAALLIWPISYVAGAWSLLAVPFIFAALGLGHGQYFLNRQPKWIKAERIDFMLRPFFGRDPRTEDAANQNDIEMLMSEYGMKKLYWRCVAGMGLKGFVIGLAPFVIGVFFSYAALAYLFTGPLMAISYMTGYQWFADKQDVGTVAAEWLTGASRGLITVLIFRVFLNA